MYIQDIVCPRCGQITAVNVVDTPGTTHNPCSRCDEKIAVVVTDDGKVHDIYAAGASTTVDSYVAIVYLWGAASEDLQKLEASLEKIKFKKTVNTKGGPRKLPRATYVAEDCRFTIRQAFNRIQKAVADTGKAHEIIVFRWNTYWGSLLSP